MVFALLGAGLLTCSLPNLDTLRPPPQGIGDGILRYSSQERGVVVSCAASPKAWVECTDGLHWQMASYCFLIDPWRFLSLIFPFFLNSALSS